MDRDVEVLPKAHLHAHADGCFPLRAVQGLAARRGRSFEPPPALFESTDEFYRRYVEVPALVETLDDLAELCRAMAESDASHGAVYLEPGVEPQLYAPRLGAMDDVLQAMISGFQAGADAAGIEAGCMVGVNTDHAVELAEEVARVAARQAGDGVVAFGTAGFAEPAGLARFRGAVGIARAAGLLVVSHAGQTGGPGSVVEALDELAPDRIAHGIHAARDPRLLGRLADAGVVCDVCVTSNVRLGVVPSYEEHPLPAMLAAGVPVTLNADDELWFGSSIADEYRLAGDRFGLSDEILAGIAMAGTRRAGASRETIERMVAGIEAWLTAA